MGRTPQLEGEDRHVEGVEYAERLGPYAELRKPEHHEVPEDKLLDGYEPAGDQTTKYTRKAFLALAKDIGVERANITAQSFPMLWHEETGLAWVQSERGTRPPDWQEQALRDAGYERFRVSAHQRRGGIIPPDSIVSPYHSESSVHDDIHFTERADYLTATDRLSPPVSGEATDPEFVALIMDRLGGTLLHDGFDSIVLRRPRTVQDNFPWLMKPGNGRADRPQEWELSLPVYDQHTMRDEAIVADPESLLPLAVKTGQSDTAGPMLHYGKYRGTLLSLPDLPECEWACLTVGNDYEGDTLPYLETVAERLGNGVRVFIEGYNDEPKVLVPIQFGFAPAARG